MPQITDTYVSVSPNESVVWRTTNHVEWDQLPQEERFYQASNLHDRPKIYFAGLYSVILNEVIICEMEKHSYLERERGKYPFSPEISKLIDQGFRPKDFVQLVHEWPHPSVTDSKRIAYTRSVEHGEQDRQTVTNLGKYLRRHFDLPDHIIRDVVAACTLPEVTVTNDMPEMIRVVVDGPHSCMSYDFGHLAAHPYEAYDPSYGWGMAYMEDGDGEIISRALVFEGEAHGEEYKCYVRTYSSPDSSGYTQRSEGMEHKLKELGYEERGGWPVGAKLRVIHDDEYYVLPYLDGYNDHVEHRGEYFEISNGSDGMDATQADGLVENTVACDCCGDSVSRSDLREVGPHHETEVCNSCFEYSYIYTIADYYEHEDNVVRTECGDYVPEDMLDYYGVVRVDYSGDYRYFYASDCVMVWGMGWVPEDELEDESVVELEREYAGYMYAPEDDVVQLRSGGFLHENDTDGYVEVDGEWVPESELTDEDREVLGEAA